MSQSVVVERHDPSAMITIKEETMTALGEYTKVSIAFMVESKYVALPNACAAGWTLTEEQVYPPWIKDYDGGEPPTRWLRWDTSNWRILSAFSGDQRIGGAIVVHDSPELDFLEGRDDVAALWDIRVDPEWRGKGIGAMLFESVVDFARSRRCKEIKVETQDVNVPACRFYEKQGCRLIRVTPNAYPGWLGEHEFIWLLEL